LRLKTKNSYSTILLHGVMNIFGKWIFRKTNWWFFKLT
jgi:hypothetical protein